MNELVLIEVEKLNPVEVFMQNGMAVIVDKIRKDVKSEVLDVTTAAGRKRIASLAHKIAKSKTALDDMGADVAEEWKQKAKIVDKERKYARDELDALKQEIRQPLTDWENAEEARVSRLKGMIEETIGAGKFTLERWATLSVEAMQDRRDEIQRQIAETKWEEFEDWAKTSHAEAIDQITTAIEQKRKYDAEQAELIELREQKAKQEALERDRQIAERAAQEATQKAEAAAKAEADRTAAAAMEQVNRLAKAAKEAAEKAEIQRLQIQKEKEDAERRAAEAEARSAREAQEAVERERERIAESNRQEEAARAKREADKAHRAEIDTKAMNAISDIIDSDIMARALVEAIAEGRIPNVTIQY